MPECPKATLYAKEAAFPALPAIALKKLFSAYMLYSAAKSARSAAGNAYNTYQHATAPGQKDWGQVASGVGRTTMDILSGALNAKFGLKGAVGGAARPFTRKVQKVHNFADRVGVGVKKHDSYPWLRDMGYNMAGSMLPEKQEVGSSSTDPTLYDYLKGTDRALNQDLSTRFPVLRRTGLGSTSAE